MDPQATFSYRPIGAGSGEITATGSFPHPHWLAHLGSALATRRASIVSGEAFRGHADEWQATFRLDVSNASSDLARLAVADLAAASTERHRGGIAVHDWTLSRRPDGLLVLTVEAEDSLGFLGRLLSRLALLALVPVELTLATTEGLVRDRIVLARVGGAAPVGEVEAALRDVMSRAAATERRSVSPTVSDSSLRN